uniref:protein SIEVE ELEMENT OCCLUSION B-like n=1 Tax=Erigeron canadensis TaxID=72917 RepID=UPI001CB968EC|nr:protein SIEVE ELEMENT OCCLUSION B-like [Erigeron canadensis]
MAARARTQHASADLLTFSLADDSAMMTHILSTHAPDGTFFNITPLIQIMEDIMHRANPNASSQGHQVELDVIVEDGMSNEVNATLELLALTINKVSCEISCKCVEDQHGTTTGILNMLSRYKWDAKAVITLAAFSVNYAEFWLVAQHYTANPFAESVLLLKQLPSVLEHGEALSQCFEAISTLITAMLDLTRHIVGFKEHLDHQYLSTDTPDIGIATNEIPTGVYWTIRSIVACASTLFNLIGMRHKRISMTDEASELSSLAHKISNIKDRLWQQFDLYNHHINKKKHIEAYQTILRIMDTPHLDNVTPLRHLISLKDDLLPLYKNSTKKRVKIDILKKMTVLLLISDLQLPLEELSVLDQKYREARHNPTRAESQFEIVWLAMVPNSKTTQSKDADQIKFEALRNMMPWYCVAHPSLIEPAGIKYIKEVWHFNTKPLLVVMDPQGRIVNTNAFNMMWIWGFQAFPFTSQREESLWQEETWRMELLTDSIEPMIFNWISKERYICLYGGEDIKWIRKFTQTIKDVAHAAGIPLELLYVGKSNPREKVQKNNDIIRDEKLSYVLPDVTHIWYFWVRLESMLHSKLHFGKSFDEDPILREIDVMLSYDSDDQGWAVVCRGSSGWMRRVNCDTLLTSLTNYKEWQDDAQEKGFLPALNDHFEAYRPPLRCSQLILPGNTGNPRRAKSFKGLRQFFKRIISD